VCAGAEADGEVSSEAEIGLEFERGGGVDRGGDGGASRRTSSLFLQMYVRSVRGAAVAPVPYS